LICRKTPALEKDSGDIKRKTALLSWLQKLSAGLPRLLKKKKD